MTKKQSLLLTKIVEITLYIQGVFFTIKIFGEVNWSWRETFMPLVVLILFIVLIGFLWFLEGVVMGIHEYFAGESEK